MSHFQNFQNIKKSYVLFYVQCRYIHIYIVHIKTRSRLLFLPVFREKNTILPPDHSKILISFWKKFCQKYQNLCYTPDLIPCNIQRGKMVPSTSFQVKDEHRVFCFESNRIHSADEVDGRVTNEHQTKILNEYN